MSNFKSSIPNTYKISNPTYKSLCREQRYIAGKLAKQKQKLADKQMEMERSETLEKAMNRYLRQKSEIFQTVELYQADLDVIKQKKSDTPKHVDINEVKPQEELFTVVNDRKQLIDTIKMVGYRAETSLANEIKTLTSNPDEARNVIRSIYQSNADLVVDRAQNRLYVMLHHSNFAHVDKIIRELFKKLNKTQSVMPGSDLTLYYQLVSEKKPE